MTFPYQNAYPQGLAWDAPLNIHPLGTLLDDATTHHGKKVAIAFMGKTITYRNLHTHVQTLAAHLQTQGVNKGDRVALCLPNCPAAVVAYYAVVKIGAIVVNTNPLYTEAELGHILRDSAAKAVITTNLAVSYPKIAPLVGQGSLRHMVLVDFPAELPWHLGLLFRLFKGKQLAAVKANPHTANYHHLLTTQATPQPVPIHAQTDLAVIQYTGGTTGTPKGAMLTHAALTANVRQIQLWLGDVPEGGDRTLAILPLFHCFAMTAGMNLSIANGGQLHLLPQLDMNRLLATLKKQTITLLPGVPTLFNAILNHPHATPAHFTHLRYGISGGAPLPPEVKTKFEALTNSRLIEGYGLTEASPVAACNPRHVPSRTGSAGLPLPHTTIAIRNPEKPTAKPLKTGEVGEVWIHGPQLMQGYWNNPEATQDCLQNGWLRTGDLGFMDADGYLHLTDRLKDIILVNGYNVYPRVIEDALHTHPAVRECMVIGLPDAKKGEAPHAYVVLKDGASATADDLLSYARKHLNPLERPIAVVLRQTLPKTQVGKLSKKDLRKEVLGN